MSFFKNEKSWPLVPLKDIATLKRGYDLPTQARKEGVIPIYAANGQNGQHNEAKIKGPGVITGRSGTIGKVHYTKNDFWPLNTALYVMSFHGNDPKWVFYLLQAFKLERFVEGAGVPTLNRNLVHGELIPLPPLEEQKRIATILDKADAIRQKRQQAITLADDFLRSVFLNMFGDPVTNPKGWPLTKCQNIFERITVGIVVKPSSYYVEAGVPALRSQNIKEYGIEKNNFVYISKIDNENTLSKSRVFEGDVVIVRTGQPGKTAVVTKEFDGVNAIDILIATPRTTYLNADYFSFFMNSAGGINLVSAEKRGQVQQHFNVGSLNNASLPLPPIELQMSFVEVLNKIKRKYFNRKNHNYDELFSSLSKKAFSGQL
ncbi:restriction endonuclease subunit S [Aeromonas salmonicida]|uniref:restriction endonuclease subunit S n=1 Tax=Aeromonas salmonicida TaxID=645 RepID=UPI000BB5BA4A|nr:restriction endonuclease subunit S [Aeromonas salmonicida]PBO13320.1 restriction endonuclease subunit S [Aeromonas salmonicida]